MYLGYWRGECTRDTGGENVPGILEGRMYLGYWRGECTRDTGGENVPGILEGRMYPGYWRGEYTRDTGGENVPGIQNSRHIYSKLHFHYKSSALPRSDNDFCASLFTIMLNDSVLLRL